MRSSHLLLLITCMHLVQGSAKSCKYWCKMDSYRYYCCPSGKGDTWLGQIWSLIHSPWFWLSFGKHQVIPVFWPEMPTMKPEPQKHCPPLRAHCPRSYDWNNALMFCEKDQDCQRAGDMCCFDVCLNHKVCKPAE